MAKRKMTPNIPPTPWNGMDEEAGTEAPVVLTGPGGEFVKPWPKEDHKDGWYCPRCREWLPNNMVTFEEECAHCHTPCTAGPKEEGA